METLDRLTYLFKQYENILGWYRQAESKATLLHAINGATLRPGYPGVHQGAAGDHGRLRGGLLPVHAEGRVGPIVAIILFFVLGIVYAATVAES
jgi:hypothetical protein